MEKNQITSAAGLHLWRREDRPRREGVNENSRILEETIAGKCALVTGSYVGDGAAEQSVGLGFTPAAVLAECESGERQSGSYGRRGGLALPGYPCRRYGDLYVKIVEGGFVAGAQDKVYGANAEGEVYRYLAFR